MSNEKHLTDTQRDKLMRSAATAYTEETAYKRYENLDLLIYLITIIIFLFSIKLFICEPIVVEGQSMETTLIDGERMFVEKLGYIFDEPQRGQIITCFYPGYTVSCVKRVIGIPGDVVEIRAGITYVNGSAIDEPYLHEPMYYEMNAITVPERSLFVMGDNRNWSTDSRDYRVGVIPYERVLGHARSVVWPLTKIRSL